MIKNFFKVYNHDLRVSFVLLAIRLVMGTAFIFHGWGKIQAPFSWMPEGSAAPGFLQFLAALSEFGGGIALIIGLLVPLAMLGLFFTMIAATSLHAFVLGDPFVSQGGGSYELALLYLSLTLLFMVVGPGKLSLDRCIFGKK